MSVKETHEGPHMLPQVLWLDREELQGVEGRQFVFGVRAAAQQAASEREHTVCALVA